jgi:hypothetical protein
VYQDSKVESYSQELASNLVFLGKNSWQLELAGAAIALFGVSIIPLNSKNPDKDMAHELKYRNKVSEQ